MKHTLTCLLALVLTVSLSAQKERIQKSWIKMSVENLSDRVMQPDTLYTRYTFDKSGLNISFYPGWNDHQLTWSFSGSNLTLGFDTYTIETLNDTSLVISLEGFRRITLLSEDYLSSQPAHLISIGEYNGKPLYKANHFITPRYTGKAAFRDLIDKGVSGYQVVTAKYFYATFIVTDEGKVENVKIVESISESFDQEIVKQLLNTSKKWKPAHFAGKPVQTEMFYDIKYLNSISPSSSGTIH